jgi:hypothetical protein
LVLLVLLVQLGSCILLLEQTNISKISFFLYIRLDKTILNDACASANVPLNQYGYIYNKNR